MARDIDGGGTAPVPGAGVAPLAHSEAEDMAHELERQERAARRHAVWALLGVSPTGLIPLLAATSDFGVPALIAGVALISGVEAWRAVRARRTASTLRAALERLGPP